VVFDYAMLLKKKTEQNKMTLKKDGERKEKIEMRAHIHGLVLFLFLLLH
jgi:hypothetical protein